MSETTAASGDRSVTTGDALVTPFSLSVLTATGGRASKTILPGANGQPIVNAASLAIWEGMLEHVQVEGLAGLKALVQTITPTTNQALVHGIVTGSQPGHSAPFVTTKRLAMAHPGALAPGTIARTKEFLTYPPQQFLLYLDRDDNPEDPAQGATADALLVMLDTVLPGLRAAGVLVTTSTSSGIRDKATDAWLRPQTGFHCYLLARGDLARFVDLLTVRLWTAGYGFCKLGTPNRQTGVASVLVRAAVDLSVFSPERLDYVAGAYIAAKAPFYQDRAEPRLLAGGILDLDAFPDVTAAERQDYTDRLAAARDAQAPERVRLVTAAIRKDTPTLPAAQVDALVTQRLHQADEGYLPDDFLLHFFTRKAAIAVKDLTAKYDGLRLADPHEPDYRDGGDAVFHWRGGAWCVVSWAHGIKRVYRAMPGAPPDATPGRPGAATGETRPTIRLSTDVGGIVDTAIAAVQALPQAPVIYQRARTLCVIAHHGKPPKWLRREADTPLIHEASPGHLWEQINAASCWEKYDKREDEWKPALPPRWVVEVLQGRSQWPFPPLEGIVCCPTLRPDGSILDTPGYDQSTGLYLDFNGTTFPPLRPRPTLDDARSALGRLQEVFQDFPFAVRGDAKARNPYFSAAVAATVTLVGLSAICGNIPCFGVSATAAGSGKGKLVDAISLIGTGRGAPKMGQTLDDNEELKRLLAFALEGASVCCIDNVTHPLGNQYLDMALTARAITGRMLGQTMTVEAPWNAVMFATGNNLAYRGDMTRRVVPIALDPKMEKPEERDDFTHPHLEAWVRQERPRLVVAALTILRAFFCAGCPPQGLTPYGSFEAWSDLIRTAMVWLGEADPCEGRQDLATNTDEAYERLATLLATWESCYPCEAEGASPAKTLKEVKQDIGLYATTTQVPNQWDELQAALATFDKRYDGKSLNVHTIGNALKGIEGRVISQKRLKRRGEVKKVTLWRLETV